jgi:hypothetical protein
MTASENLSSIKRILADGFLGVEPRSVGVALAEHLCGLWGGGNQIG